MQLVLGRSRRPDRQSKTCFFCANAFTFDLDEVIVCVDGEAWLQRVPERHVCPACAKLDDAGLTERLHTAARRHRDEAERLQAKAEASSRLATWIEGLTAQGVERTWRL